MIRTLMKMDRQFIIAILFILTYSPMLWWVLVKHGDRIEILTLLIGFMTGAINGVGAVYLSASTKDKLNPPGTITQTEATSTTTTKTPQTPLNP